MAIDKFITRGANGLKRVAALVSSAGVGDGGRIVALDPATGRFHLSTMPEGVGPDIQTAEATEDITAGKFVDVYTSAGVAKCRKADMSQDGRYGDGYLVTGVLTGGTATIYPSGSNPNMTGLTPGADYWLSESVTGGVQAAPPDTQGHVMQYAGVAINATTLSVRLGDPIYLND